MTKLVINGLIVATIASAGAFFALKSVYTQSKMTRLADCNSLSIEVIPSISATRYNMVLFGDSRAWEYGQWLSNNTDLTVLNMARPGETSQETVCKLANQVSLIKESEAHTPDIVLLSLGINDLVTASLNRNTKRAAIESQAAHNVLDISEQLLENFDKPIVLSVVPPIKMDPLRRILWGSGIDGAVATMNQKLQSALPSGVELLNLERVFFDTNKGKWRPDLARDALHWNDNGYAKLHKQLELRDNN